MAGLRTLWASLVMALRAVRRNTLRTGLTVLGITIGVAAVVTMTALGRGAREAVTAQVATLGSNALIVFPRSAKPSGVRGVSGSRLGASDCEALVRESTSIKACAPFLSAAGQVVYEGQNVNSALLGSELSYFEVRGWAVDRGELWSPQAEAISEKVVVIGTRTARDLFGSADPVGRVLRIGRYPYRVLGVLAEKGKSPFGDDQDAIVIMPLGTMRSHVLSRSNPNSVHALLMSAASPEVSDRAQRQAEDILRQRHRIREGDEDDFRVRSQAEFKALQDAIFGALSTLLVAIAAVSLVVGGIGVMNIMLVSVAERTREIGIRMAIGAREADILTQFLVEAVVLSLLGGIAGTAIGFGAIAAFARALDWPMKLEAFSLVVALGVSSGIGVAFGFFPARRAARLDPVEALGRE